jgi:hypothetical protein
MQANMVWFCVCCLAQADDALAAAAAGSMRVNDEQLQTRSAAKVKGADGSATLLKLTSGAEGAHFMLIEMAKSSDE